MTTSQLHLKETAELLTYTFLLNYPQKAANSCANLTPQAAAQLLQEQPLALVVPLFYYLPIGAADSIFQQWHPESTVDLLLAMDIQQATGLLARLEPEQRDALLQQLDARNKNLAKEFRDLMEFPEGTAGRLMDPKLQLFSNTLTVEEALTQIKLRRPKQLDVLFLVNQEQQLTGSLDLGDLILAGEKSKVSTLARPVTAFAYGIDSEDEVVEKFEELKISALPILNANDQLIGVIRTGDIYQQTKEDLASDMASMVGASKDEKALSSSFFAVKKRMPWLQINLLTAFAAAAVVGAFEDIISQFTALAILLPVAAGQSGNAGAQALAVTMRGLTLKEITVRHWWKVFRKESAVGLMNGVAIAVTCSIAVYFWSQSLGLALVMTLAMISSVTIACGSGALVPMVLKRFGLDPAQSSSIVLTTVTDIAGFMSFLGIATLFASMLPTG
jgi:magnesium transporter